MSLLKQTCGKISHSYLLAFLALFTPLAFSSELSSDQEALGCQSELIIAGQELSEEILALQTDPFDPVLQIPHEGEYGGAITNTKRQRPLVVLEEDNPLYEAWKIDPAEFRIVANFLHFSKEAEGNISFFMAAIPIFPKVNTAKFFKYAFEPKDSDLEVNHEMMAHSEVQFNLEEPIRLLLNQNLLNVEYYRKIDPKGDGHLPWWDRIGKIPLLEKDTVDSVVFSYEAMHLIDKDLDFSSKTMWFLKDEVPGVMRMLSTIARYHEQKEKLGPDLYEAHFSAIELKDPFSHQVIDGQFYPTLVDELLMDSHCAGVARYYHLLFGSCTSTIFAAIDRVLGKEAPSEAQLDEYFTQVEPLALVISEITENFPKNSSGKLASRFDLSPEQLAKLREALGSFEDPKKVAGLLLASKENNMLIRHLISRQSTIGLPSLSLDNLEIRGLIGPQRSQRGD